MLWSVRKAPVNKMYYYSSVLWSGAENTHNNCFTLVLFYFQWEFPFPPECSKRFPTWRRLPTQSTGSQWEYIAIRCWNSDSLTHRAKGSNENMEGRRQRNQGRVSRCCLSIVTPCIRLWARVTFDPVRIQVSPNRKRRTGRSSVG